MWDNIEFGSDGSNGNDHWYLVESGSCQEISRNLSNFVIGISRTIFPSSISFPTIIFAPYIIVCTWSICSLYGFNVVGIVLAFGFLIEIAFNISGGTIATGLILLNTNSQSNISPDELSS